MKVIALDTKQTIEVNDAYGHRLIEQGKAIPAPQEKRKPAADKKDNKDGGDA